MTNVGVTLDDSLVKFLRNYSEEFDLSISATVRRLLLLGIFCEQNHQNLSMPMGLDKVALDMVGQVCTLDEHRKLKRRHRVLKEEYRKLCERFIFGTGEDE